MKIHKVKIGAIEYSVVEEAKIISDENRQLRGQIIYKENKIKVDLEMEEQSKRLSLLHEILHAISEHYVVKLNEDQVGRLADGLGSVLPQIAWLWDEPNHGPAMMKKALEAPSWEVKHG
jgi:hypothetical protein